MNDSSSSPSDNISSSLPPGAAFVNQSNAPIIINNELYYTEEQVRQLITEANIEGDVELVFILICAIFIFLMQMGFAMLEAGTVRTKNSSNILLKNLLDTYVGAIVYYLVGYGLANDAKGGIIGNYHFASNGFNEMDYLKWILQYAVCSNIPTIVAGSLAERTFVDTYMFFALLMTGLVFPIASSWTWGGGWLSQYGFKDFAGAGVVHLLGGVCGMVGTIILGPRLGVFGNAQSLHLSPQSASEEQQQPHHTKLKKQRRANVEISECDDEERGRGGGGGDKDHVDSDEMESHQESQFKVKTAVIKSKHQGVIKMIELDYNTKIRRRSNSQNNIELQAEFLFPLQLQNDRNKKNKQNQPKHKEQSGKPRKMLQRTLSPQLTMPKVTLSGGLVTYQQNKFADQMSFISASSHIEKHYVKSIRKQQLRELRIKQAAAVSDMVILGPDQMARINKIRKEFPEFAMVDDRQLNQIIQLYDINIKSPIKPSSVGLIVQGTFYLWICWLFYNAGASQGVSLIKSNTQPSQIVMNTILSSSSACVSLLFWRPLILSKSDPTNKYPIQAICNSLLVGLVSITGCGDNIPPWASVIIGIIGTMIYCLACKLYEKLKIDDPLEASQIHAFCGLWGLLSVGLFDREQGILYTGQSTLMLKQFVGALSIILWALLTSFLYFYCLKKVNKFRVGYIYEITGMDVLMHGGTDLLSNDMIDKIEARQRSIANANRLGGTTNVAR